MSSPPPNLPAEVLRALLRGDKIEAIRLVRQITGQGLREAKEVVEGQRAFQGPLSSHQVHPAATVGQADAGNGLAPGEQPRVSLNASLLRWLPVAVVAALLVYLFVR